MRHPHRRTPARMASVGLALALTAGASFATFPTPPSGTPLTIPFGTTRTILLKNAGGCTFDYSTGFSASGVALATADTGTGLKGAKIVVSALNVGTTMLTVTTNGGTCPGAVHTYPITVTANPLAMSKQFLASLKLAFTAYRNDLKSDLKTWKGPFTAARAQFDGGFNNLDTTVDQFHAATDALAGRFYGYSWTALGTGADAGSLLLQGNDLAIGDGPVGFFMGGCGIWDDYRGDLKVTMNKSFATVKKGLKGFYGDLEEKSGVALGGVYRLPSLWQVQPLYDDQVGAETPKIPTQVTNTSVQGTTNAGADNGRVLVSGFADGTLSGSIDVILVSFTVGSGSTSTTQTVNVVNGQWTATFTGVTAGDHQVKVKFAGDTAETGALVYVPKS